MASRIPIVYIDGLLAEMPAADGLAGAVQLDATANQDLETMQPNQISIDSATGELVVRVGNLIWRFQPGGITSYDGQLNYSVSRNSHWLGAKP